MSDINIVVLLGRLVRDPLVRNNGKKMATFCLASNRRYRDKSNTVQEETAFVACKCFGGWTDQIVGRKKGDTIIVEGRLRTENWTDEGTSRSQLVLVCDSVRSTISGPPPHEPSQQTDLTGGKPEIALPSPSAQDNPPF